jgi:hypothetical protein
MAKAPPNPKEVKPSYTWRHFGLLIFSGLLLPILGAVAGAFLNQYLQDQKVIEVMISASGNLISLPENLSGNLEVRFGLGDHPKESIRGLYRFQIGIINRSKQGVDDLPVILNPQWIQLVEPPEIATIPVELMNAVKIQHETTHNGLIRFTISLLNPGQTVLISYLGITGEEADELPRVSVITAKKDWIQKNTIETRPPTFEPVGQYPAPGRVAGYSDQEEETFLGTKLADLTVLQLLFLLSAFALVVFYLGILITALRSWRGRPGPLAP